LDAETNRKGMAMTTIPFRRKHETKRGETRRDGFVTDHADEMLLVVEAERIAGAADGLEGLAVKIPGGRTILAPLAPGALEKAKLEIGSARDGPDSVEVLIRGRIDGDVLRDGRLEVRKRHWLDRERTPAIVFFDGTGGIGGKKR
jgi:hypothetical protein